MAVSTYYIVDVRFGAEYFDPKTPSERKVAIRNERRVFRNGLGKLPILSTRFSTREDAADAIKNLAQDDTVKARLEVLEAADLHIL